MNKYLIFRTDRIGDFLLSAILVKSIKRNDPNSKIFMVCSLKNFDYVKSFEFIDEIFLIKKGIFNKLKLLNKLTKNHYKSIIIHDGKKRSSILSFFLISRLKISINRNLDFSHFHNILKILERLNFNFSDIDLNLFESRSFFNKKKFNYDYSVFHFDEKWVHEMYIKNYKNIEPTQNELISLMNDIVTKTKMKLIITTGKSCPNLLNIASSNNNNNNITFFKNLNILELEEIILNSKLLISCHGSVSHMASGKSIKQIDIVDQNIKNPYDRWTEHFRNYFPLYRCKFNDLSKKIINLL
tara:strand:+ start:84 stop:977 length:894 start_codon:yes stop_codon:yes gene_type:complete